MKIVRNKSTYQVVYMFSDNTPLTFDDRGLKMPGSRAITIKPETHEIVLGVERIESWKIKAMGFNMGWFIYDQDLYDALYDEQLQVEIEKKCDRVMTTRLQKTYSDVEVVFPDGVGTIQMRNDFDRSNLSDVALGALAIATLQNPNKLMYYRDAENITHELKASEMITIALGVLDIKQQVVTKSWNHKDTIRNLTTLEEVRNYDIETDWPV